MSFTVCSWNILADAYARADRYPGVVPGALNPTDRHALLLDRVASLTADVICLHEVEQRAFVAIAARLGTLCRWSYVCHPRQRSSLLPAALQRKPACGNSCVKQRVTSLKAANGYAKVGVGGTAVCHQFAAIGQA